MLGVMALGLVSVGLVATLIAQFRPRWRFAALADTLALVPGWRFYALAADSDAAALGEDYHLIVRDADAAGRVGAWRAILWQGDARWTAALWNPGRRADETMLSIAQDIAEPRGLGAATRIQTSTRYLSLLRRALAAPPEGAAARQFAVVRTRGRGVRTIEVTFVSAFHRW